MPSGKIFLKHNFSSVTGYLIIALFENTAPAAELISKRITIAAPHSERGDTITGLNPVMHTAKFYQSTDGTTLETFILSMALDASIYNESIVAQFDYVVDRGDSGAEWADPVNGAALMTDTRLDGFTQDQMRFEVRGGKTYRNDEYSLVTGGGVNLLGGETFSDTGNTYRITTFNNVAQQVSTSSTSDTEFALRVLENADFTAGAIDFDVTLYNTIAVVNYTGNIATVVLPDLTLVPDTKVRFTTHLNPARNLVIQLDAGDTVKFLGVNVNAIILGRGEEVELRVKSNVLYVTYYSGVARNVGQRIWGDRLELNTLYRDGTEYDQADWPRLMAFIDTLGVGQVVDYTTWASSTLLTDATTGVAETVYPYKGLYARNDGTGKFKVPDDRNMFIRALANVTGSDDAERIIDQPGGYQQHSNNKYRDTRGNDGTTATGIGYAGGSPGTFQFRYNVLGGVESRGRNIGMLPLLVV